MIGPRRDRDWFDENPERVLLWVAAASLCVAVLLLVLGAVLR